jgi:3-mercaptopyruvate sulfurtransferase SseA
MRREASRPVDGRSHVAEVPTVSGEWLQADLDDPHVRIVEQSETDVNDCSAGHLPGAPFWYRKDATSDPRDRDFEVAGASPDQVREVVVYRRLSHRASMLWSAMTRIVGWNHVRVYDGSWTEWGSIVGFPVGS